MDDLDEFVAHSTHTLASSSFLERTKQSLFAVLHLLTKGGIPPTLVLVMNGVEVVQLVTFPMRVLRFADPRLSSSNLKWLDTVLNATNLVFAIDNGPLRLFLFLLALLWSFMFATAIFYIAYRIRNRLVLAKWTLKTVRSVARVSTTTLFLPFTSVFFSEMACQNNSGTRTTDSLGNSCHSTPHYVMLLITAVVQLVSLSLSLLVSLLFVNRAPLSRQWTARSTGRVDAILLCFKFSFSFMFNAVFFDLPPAFIVCVLLGGAVAWLAGLLLVMPFTNPSMMAVKVGSSVVFLWVCVGAAVSLAVDMGSSDNVVIGMLLTVPMLFQAGRFFAQHRLRGINDMTKEEAAAKTHLALVWARKRMQEFMQEQSYSRKTNRRQAANAEQHMSAASVCDQTVLLATTPHSSSMPRTAHRMTGQNMATTTRAQSQADSAEWVLQQLKKRLPGWAAVYLELAHLYRLRHTNFVMEALMLQRAHQSSAAVDVQFTVYTRARELGDRDETMQAVAGLDSIEQLIYRQHWREARVASSAYWSFRRKLMKALTEQSPVLQEVLELCSPLPKLCQRIVAELSALKALRPNDPNVLLFFAEVSEDLLMNAQMALEASSRAEKLRCGVAEQVHREVVFGTIIRQVSLPNDLAATTLVLDGSPDMLGNVVTSSVRQMAELGDSKAAAAKRNLRDYIVPPFNRITDRILQQLVTNGDAQEPFSVRMMPVWDADGTLVPASLQLRPRPPAPGKPAGFLVHYKPLSTFRQFMVVDARSRSLVAATKATHALLGTNPGEAVNIADAVPDLFRVLGVWEAAADSTGSRACFSMNGHQVVTRLHSAATLDSPNVFVVAWAQRDASRWSPGLLSKLTAALGPTLTAKKHAKPRRRASLVHMSLPEPEAVTLPGTMWGAIRALMIVKRKARSIVANRKAKAQAAGGACADPPEHVGEIVIVDELACKQNAASSTAAEESSGAPKRVRSWRRRSTAQSNMAVAQEPRAGNVLGSLAVIRRLQHKQVTRTWVTFQAFMRRDRGNDTVVRGLRHVGFLLGAAFAVLVTVAVLTFQRLPNSLLVAGSVSSLSTVASCLSVATSILTSLDPGLGVAVASPITRDQILAESVSAGLLIGQAASSLSLSHLTDSIGLVMDVAHTAVVVPFSRRGALIVTSVQLQTLNATNRLAASAGFQDLTGETIPVRKVVRTMLPAAMADLNDAAASVFALYDDMERLVFWWMVSAAVLAVCAAVLVHVSISRLRLKVWDVMNTMLAMPGAFRESLSRHAELLSLHQNQLHTMTGEEEASRATAAAVLGKSIANARRAAAAKAQPQAEPTPQGYNHVLLKAVLLLLAAPAVMLVGSFGCGMSAMGALQDYGDALDVVMGMTAYTTSLGGNCIGAGGGVAPVATAAALDRLVHRAGSGGLLHTVLYQDACAAAMAEDVAACLTAWEATRGLGLLAIGHQLSNLTDVVHAAAGGTDSNSLVAAVEACQRLEWGVLKWATAPLVASLADEWAELWDTAVEPSTLWAALLGVAGGCSLAVLYFPATRTAGSHLFTVLSLLALLPQDMAVKLPRVRALMQKTLRRK